jgi:hypothetical protein
MKEVWWGHLHLDSGWIGLVRLLGFGRPHPIIIIIF